MKDKLGGKIMTEFATLRPKINSYLTAILNLTVATMKTKTQKVQKNMP